MARQYSPTIYSGNTSADGNRRPNQHKKQQLDIEFSTQQNRKGNRQQPTQSDWNLPSWQQNRKGNRQQPTWSDWSLPSWNPGNYQFPQVEEQAGSQANPWQFGYQQGPLPGLPDYGRFDEYASNYYNTLLPWMQAQQNAYQYGQDFNEAQRRFNLQYGMQASMNEYSMALSTRQQKAAEEQARLAAEQWNRQFGWTQTTDRWSYNLANRELAQEAALTKKGYQNAKDLANIRGRYDVRTANISANASKYNADQQLAGTKYGWDTQADIAQGQLDLGYYETDQRTMTQMEDIRARERMQQYGEDAETARANARNELERWRTTHQIGLGYSELEQTGALERERLAQQRWVEEYQAQQQMRQLQKHLAQQRWAEEYQAKQQMRQLQERLAAEERMAIMQAYGRAQVPTARWVRNW